MLPELSHSMLFRSGLNPGEETISIDFLVNDESLLAILGQDRDAPRGFMGRILRNFPDLNAEAVAKLKANAAPDTGRVILYACPLCGDLACGALTVFVERTPDAYVWRDFAYENGYEDPLPVEGVGPFRFGRDQYEAALSNASEFAAPAPGRWMR